MKTIKLGVLLTAMIILSIQAFAIKDEFTKKITKSFDINKDATLVVKSKFGKIHCENWDKNSIAIEVEITVNVANQEKANKYFEKINIDLTGSSSRVTATTSFDDNMFSKNDNEISIDYMISMPASINLEIDHKFGDIILDVVNGSSSIEIGYGSLKANKLNNESNDLEIKFSDASIGFVKNADLELQYSDMEIDKAVSMSVECKFSEFNIGEIDMLTMESGYDDDVIGKVRDMDVEASFSDIEIRSLSEKLVADCDYGSIKVKEVKNNFKLIDISNSFSDANIGFNADASFRLVANIKMGDLSYPRDKARLTEVEISYTSKKYEGVVGANAETSSKVLVEAKNSGVNLFYR
jgi:hypothetical protein